MFKVIDPIRVYRVLNRAKITPRAFDQYIDRLGLRPDKMRHYWNRPFARALARRCAAEVVAVRRLGPDLDYHSAIRGASRRVRRALDWYFRLADGDTQRFRSPAGAVARRFAVENKDAPRPRYRLRGGFAAVAPPLPPRRRQRGFAAFAVAVLLSVAAAACAAFAGDFSGFAAALAVAPAAVARAPKKRASPSPRVIDPSTAALVAEGWRPIVLFYRDSKIGVRYEYCCAGVSARGSLIAECSIVTDAFVYVGIVDPRGVVYRNVFSGKPTLYEGPTEENRIARLMLVDLASRRIPDSPPDFCETDSGLALIKDFWAMRAAIIDAGMRLAGRSFVYRR